MQRLRVLTLVSAIGACLALPAHLPAAEPPVKATPPRPTTAPAPGKPAQPPASAAAAAAAAAEASKPKPQAVGEILDAATPLPKLFPQEGNLALMPRQGRPLLLYFWATGANLAREELKAAEALAAQGALAGKLDVVAVAGFKADKQSPADVLDMLRILEVKGVTVALDKDYALATRLGVSQFPEYVYVDKAGTILLKGVRGMDHGHLGEPPRTAGELVDVLAKDGTFPQVARTWPFYPSDRLIGQKYHDAELPLFSPEGYGKGKLTRLSSLLSGKRPGVVMFFSATCEHCQVDVPQIVKFMQAHPDSYDVVGITRIRHANHRKVSTDYFAAQGIKFPVLEDPGGIADLYRVTSTPTSFYLSPAGAVGSISYYQHQDLERQWTELRAKLMALPPPKPARKATGWHFPLKVRDEKGAVVDVSSFAGKPTVIHFWATWCGPCRKELPELVARLPEIAKNANVLLVSTEGQADLAKIAKYKQETGLSFPAYLAPHDGLAKSIDFARSVPRTYVLDAAGNVDSLYMGAVPWTDPDRYAAFLGRLVRP